MEQVKELIHEYADVFSSPEKAIGETSLIEFQVKLQPGTQPVKQKVQPLKHQQKEDLGKQLELWQKEGVIEETKSPWSSALVPVLKKDGSIRWAIDYPKLNKVTVANVYPLPNIQYNLERL